MQFESRWEKQQRLKRQKRSSVAGMITAVILVLLLGVAMWNGKEGCGRGRIRMKRCGIKCTLLSVHGRKGI